MMSLINRLLGNDEEEDRIRSTPESKRIVGKIIKISPEGWGFISSKDIEFTRIFFHWTALQQDTLHFTELRKGMKVEFESLSVDGKGLRAIRIKVLEED